MDCPRCAEPGVLTPSCTRCGIVLAKWKGDRARPSSRPEGRTARARGEPWLPIVGLLLVGAAAAYALRAPAALAPASTPAPEPIPFTPTPASMLPALPPPTLPPVEAPKVQPGAGIPDGDRSTAARLAGRLDARLTLAATDLAAAEDLFARYPAQEPLRNLLGGVLVSLSVQERMERRFDQSLLHLRRAIGMGADDPKLRASLVDLLLETGDWPAAEVAAREWLAAAPRDPDALRGLAFALLRQDRNREAEETLRASLEIREDPAARVLLDRLRTGMASEKGMTEQQLAYFHVRYDGEAHEDVGREILRALERHHATLVRTFDHQPTATIPVILFTRQGYYDTTGAPAWAGGHFDSIDGRVRLPIGGLTTALTPDMDDTLIHELTHAFVNDQTRGVAPRDLHEGLAQYMEGKRVASLLSPADLKTLAGGRAGGVGGFYVEALSFVEFLVAERGQGGINDLLEAMAETGNASEAYRQVYGRDADGSHRAWRDRLRQLYGS